MYHQNYYKFIGIDLPRQTNTSIPEHVNFVWKVEEDDRTIMFFISEQKNHQKILKNPQKILKHQKILNSLNEANDSELVARKWNIVNDQPFANYNVGREIINNTKV